MLSLAIAGALLLQTESPGRLIDLLGSDDEAVRSEAARKLEALGPEAIDELKSAIANCKPRTRQLALQILTTIESRRAPEVLDSLRQALLKPRTCRVTVRIVVHFDREFPDHHATADVVLAGADQARIESRAQIREDWDTLVWTSNGKTARRKLGDRAWETLPAPAELRKKMVDALLGIRGSEGQSWVWPDFSEEPPRSATLVGAVPATFGSPEPGLKFEVVENPARRRPAP